MLINSKWSQFFVSFFPFRIIYCIQLIPVFPNDYDLSNCIKGYSHTWDIHICLFWGITMSEMKKYATNDSDGSDLHRASFLPSLWDVGGLLNWNILVLCQLSVWLFFYPSSHMVLPMKWIAPLFVFITIF